MPNSIGPLGLTLSTRAELISFYTAQFQAIYGADIDLNSDSPDGQLMNIFVQSVLDLQDLLSQVYNMFDPDNALGNILDQRVAINGIQRQAGTFTVTNITITVSQALTLYGLDQSTNPVYTVQDNAGNQWELITTQNPSGSGSSAYAFQSKVPGAVLTVPNTITIPVTVIIGVTSINNPTTYTTLGLNEETDAALKIRRQKSVALSSQGWVDGLFAALENINGLTSVFVYENTTSSSDGDGIPGHSIWVIVSGSAPSATIALAIYSKRNAGCGMKGTQTFVIAQSDGSNFTVRWDVVTPVDLFIKFTATSLDGVNDPRINDIRDGLVTSFVPGVSEEVNVNAMATKVQEIDPNTLVTLAGFSLTAGGSYTNTLTPVTKDKQFSVTAAKVIILPMINSPATATVPNGGTQQFTGLGGYGTLVYTIHTDGSGGAAVNSSTGLYTAGSTPSTTDVVRVTDSLGNFADATVSVT